MKPSWKLMGHITKSKNATWRRATFLYLMTTAINYGPAVYHGKSGLAIPAYLLPLLSKEKEDIYFWTQSYVYHDNVWLDSGTLETRAYKELVDPLSELSKKGRELCTLIEKKTTVPTYYYLARYYSRSKGEEGRPCPLCGGNWRTQYSSTKVLPFHYFPFQCKKCRLVSHIGSSVEGAHKARIGDFHPRKD